MKIKEATTIIFKAIGEGAPYLYVLGMLDFGRKLGAITPEEAKALEQYLEEREDKLV